MKPHDLVDLFSAWLWSLLLIVMMLTTSARLTIWLAAAVRDTWRKSFPAPTTKLEPNTLDPWPAPPARRKTS